MKIQFSPDSISREELARLKKLTPDELPTNVVEKHLFKYKAYKKRLEKDLIKAKKFLKSEPEATLEFYLCMDYEYTDRPEMPLLVVGKAAGQWKPFLKQRILKHKMTDAVGLVRFDDSKKSETGMDYLELTIEKGKPKQKLIKKLMDKWLMPSGLEISFGGDADLSEEVIPEGPSLPRNLPIELDEGDQVQALFLAWQANKYAGKEEQKVRLKIKTYIDKWQEKYEVLAADQQQKVQTKKAQYDYILDCLDAYEAPEDEGSSAPGITGIVLEGGDGTTTLSRINISSFGLNAPGKIDRIKKTNFSKIYAALEGFNKETDIERKRKVFDGVMSMIDKWVTHHKKDKVSTDKTKNQLQGLETLYKQYQKFMTSYEGVTLENATRQVSDNEKLFNETAGNKKSSEAAKDVRDATIDDRALQLAQLLQRGKASNDDKTFGAVVDWLADNVYQELEGKYIAATEQLFKKKSALVSDVISVFGIGTLRTLYLLDKLKGEENQYAKLAFALGLMGKTWLLKVVTLGQEDTVEREDAMSIMIKGYPATTVQKLLDSEASVKTFEGAIADYLRREHPNMRRQMEAHLNVQEARESGDTEAINRANDAYLTSMIHRLRKEGRFGKKLDKDQLLQGLYAWLENASDAERKAMLDPRSAFMTQLTDMSGTFTYSGIDKGDVAFIREKLKAKKELPDNKKTNAVFEHLKALAEKQSTKNAVSRWIQDKDVGKQFQQILFGQDIKDPQKAVVSNFCTDEEFNKWEQLEKDLTEELQKPEDQQDRVKIATLNEEREEIFERAYGGVQALMDRAQVNHDVQKEISETLRSNGAKGTVYQELVAMAKGRVPVVNFGKDVRLVLAKLGPSDKQLAAIKADKDLLEILQARTLGRMGLEDNKKQWTIIAKELGLKPPLSNTELSDEQLSEQRDIDNFKREHRVNRAKLQSKEELAQQQQQVEEQKKSPAYWAARLVTSYKTSRLTTDEHILLQLMFEAQKKGVKVSEVLTELEQLSGSTYKYIQNEDNYACETIRDVAEDDRPIKAKEMLLDSRESVTLKRQVDAGEVDKLIALMSPEELLQEAFDFEALQENVEAKKEVLQLLEQTEDEEVRAQQQGRLEELNKAIKRFDISPEFMDDLDRVLPPQKAIKVKAAMRGKVGDALTADGDNPTKTLIKDLGGFTDADMKLMGADIRAISAIEYEKQSETGLQWSSVSSRMLQRKVADSDFLTKGWERNERLEAMTGVLNESDLEQEKEVLAKGMLQAEAQLEEARQKFEERKGELDKKLAQAINALMQAVFFTLTMASGVGAAAGIVQLVWALSSAFMQTTISETIRMVTSGDRSGGALDKAEDFFFAQLASQAGAITGLIGTNLAFALDVKALGVMSQGTGPDGKPLLSSWENILRTPFLKTAKGILSSTFNDIGQNFVERVANEKDSVLKDPIGDLAAWGEKTVKSLPKRYLKSLIMTTAATGAGALAKELDWDFLKYHNPNSASKNRYTANGEDRAFQSSDARLGFFNSDAENFSDWFNGWGMFDASPSFGGNAAWKGGSDPLDGFISVFSSAAENLQDPKVLTALANSVVWGSMDGSKHGIKQQLGGMVDKSLDNLTVYRGKPIDPKTRDKLKEQMENSLEASIQKQQKELVDALDEGYGSNLTEEQIEKLRAGEYNPQEMMILWNQFDWIGDGQDAKNNLKFFNKVASVLSLNELQMKLYRREKVCRPFRTVDEFVLHYNENKEEYKRVLGDKVFVDTYVAQRNGAKHPKQIQYTISFDGEDLDNIKDLEGDLNAIYAEWKKLKEMDAKDMTFVF